MSEFKVPNGWKLAPEEPTREMFVAANKADDKAYAGGCHHGADNEDIWHAMLAAAPAAPVADGTTSDKYRAELYDEVWQRARDMGYGNVTEALVELERLKAAAPVVQAAPRCQCCGYLVTQSEHRGCLRAAAPPAQPDAVLVETMQLLEVLRGRIGGALWSLDSEDRELAERTDRAIAALSGKGGAQ